MPALGSKRFAAVLTRALARSGRLKPKDLRALRRAREEIPDGKEAVAAGRILSLLTHDQELDSFEVGPVREALGTLLGNSGEPLPKELAAALRHAVPRANVEVKHYQLTFDLSGRRRQFPARAVVELDRPVSQTAILEVDPDRLTVSKVYADGKPVPFEVKDGRLRITAPGALRLRIDYALRPDETVSEASYGLIRDRYTGRMWTMTWPYHTGSLFPSNSNPADGSTAQVTVKVHPGTQVVTTGTGRSRAGATQAESPAYAIAFYTAKDFEVGDGGSAQAGVGIKSFGKPGRISEANREAYREAARASLDFYSRWLGSYEYGPTLKLVEVRGGLGGMEHTAAVALMTNAVRDRETAEETAAHETAHHWFGNNLRIKSWSDFWMSEGFTNYATFRYFRDAQGERKFASLLSNARAELNDELNADSYALSAPRHSDPIEIFDAVPYQMGAWMLRMMEVELGTARFDPLLRAWFQEHRQKAVSTEEFIAFAKRRAGHDFGPFFARWSHLSAVPRFVGHVEVRGSRVEVQLEARSKGFPKGLRIPLRLEGAGQSKTVMVDPTRPLRLDVGFPVVRYRWDPEVTTLAYVTRRKSAPRHGQRTRNW